MEDHGKTIITLIIIGGLIGMSKLLVSDEKITFRVLIGRTILGSASSLVAGLVLLQIPDISPLALIGIASALGILGSTYIEEYLKKHSKKWGG
ncbi:holin [Acinetobacter sp. ANC 4558]|uniref:holin n=1 Tax=Acinetobacter sp. ANC 4558 TaxID=1977876 RepID=UPI000A330A42|nr:holin [Acinetobacter sp. ANC 4558]OTG79568.1 holin [Acinetobacter sp. ANC 4558]